MAEVTEDVAKARLVLLDALEALGEQRDAMILVGAQAVYLRTGDVSLAVSEYTRDADLAIDTERIAPHPKLDQLLTAAAFTRGGQPGTWFSTKYTSSEDPIPVDFLVAEAMGGRPGRRAATVPGQPDNSARQVRGLEAALIDNNQGLVGALSDDPRSFQLRIAGAAALVVAKVHKIAERIDTSRGRDKDALDIYRLLRTVEPDDFAQRFAALLNTPVSREPTQYALGEFSTLFGSTRAPGVDMVVRATSGLEPEQEVRRSTLALAQDLIGVIGKST